MDKNTFYFSHDYSARSDFKIKRLLQKHGFTGYGIYWAIIEDLYINNNTMAYDIDMLCYEYRCDSNIITSILNDFDLFVIDNNVIRSESISNRLNIRNEKSQKGRENALKRWGDDGKRTKAINNIFYILRFYNDNEEFIKCGVTENSISRRYAKNVKGYEHELIKQFETTLTDGLYLENFIADNFQKYMPKNKFGGYLECYNISDLQAITDVAMQKLCDANAIKERKVKESKGNLSISKDIEKPIRKHSFEKSEYFDKDKFKDAFPDWSKDKLAHYYQSAQLYSQANGAKYLNWALAIKNWDRKNPYNPKKLNNYESRKSELAESIAEREQRIIAELTNEGDRPNS